MPEISVSFESLASGQDSIKGVYTQLTATLDQLESDLQPMVSSWSGSAQESYLQCKKQWEEAAAALSIVLSQIGQAVGTANENYQAAERAAKNNWA
jgi:early secretory antigenic target protein ESAT-6